MRKLLARLARRFADRLDPAQPTLLLAQRRYMPSLIAFFDKRAERP